jgi:hypothetical protein
MGSAQQTVIDGHLDITGTGRIAAHRGEMFESSLGDSAQIGLKRRVLLQQPVEIGTGQHQQIGRR